MIASREAGLARLQDFLPRAGRHYAELRNVDRGAGQQATVSGLSPYLRHRLISEQEVVGAVLQQHGFPASEKFVQEVCWRSYWKGWLQQRPAVWMHYCKQRDALQAQMARDEALRSHVLQALAGDTGIDCFDAWARELRDTGYLHNHARMWFASIWIFTLRLPWELGADFFMQHLLDADAASNTLSWRWVAGLHTAGKHYLARADNIARFTEGRFNPTGQLDENACALPADAPVAAASLPSLPSARADQRSALLITDEDCSIESQWPCAIAPPVCIAIWRGGIRRRSANTISPQAEAFSQSALDDALHRARRIWPEAEILADGNPVLDGLRQNRIEQLMLAEPCVGAAADALAPLLGDIRNAGIPIVPLRRDWDAALWPHATRGYFALRQQLPRLLDTVIAAA